MDLNRYTQKLKRPCGRQRTRRRTEPQPDRGRAPAAGAAPSTGWRRAPGAEQAERARLRVGHGHGAHALDAMPKAYGNVQRYMLAAAFLRRFARPTQEAERMRDEYTSTEHLLLGILV